MTNLTGPLPKQAHAPRNARDSYNFVVVYSTCYAVSTGIYLPSFRRT